MSIFIDLTGKRFGRLVVVKLSKPRPKRGAGKGPIPWICKCDCGNICKVFSSNLTRQWTQSCGCLQKERASEAHLKHGHTSGPSKTKEYITWTSMKTRCYNKKRADYPDYGGRGIKVCDRWLNSFENFLDDMGSAPSKHHSIDRINNDGNYEPVNCCWNSDKKQARNRRNNVWYIFSGQKKTLVEWSEITGLRDGLISRRIKQGWTIDEALSTPTLLKYRNKKGGKK